MGGCDSVGDDTVTRAFEQHGKASTAVYSACDRYRFQLSRVWDQGQPSICYIMLNPSTATEMQNDPTIERCERRAVMLGFGGMDIVNLFAVRKTDPALMRKEAAPTGQGNDLHILKSAQQAGLVLAAWGVHGVHLGRGAYVQEALRHAGVDLHVLGLTKDGHPRHPLYMPYSAAPIAW